MAKNRHRSIASWHRRAVRDNGHVGNKKGARNEARALEALQGGSLPSWVRSVRAATPEEDAHGKDIIAVTDVGEIGLQVKSGRSTAESYYKKGNFDLIGLIVVRPRHTNAQLVDQAARELEEIRYGILRGSAGFTVTP